MTTMTEKKQALNLADGTLSQVTGGSSSYVDENGFTITEQYYCPDCGAKIELREFKKTELVLIGKIPTLKEIKFTKLACDRCGKTWYPSELKGNPKTYWHLVTRTFK